MSGFFGVVSKAHTVEDIFYITLYHQHRCSILKLIIGNPVIEEDSLINL
jgi:hypothetical protein